MEKTGKKVAVLTDFLDFPLQYGLVPAVLNQLKTLQDHGYNPDLYVVEGTENEESVKLVPDGIKIKPYVPFMHLYDYQSGTKEQKHKVGPIGEYGEPSKTNLKKQVQLTEELLEMELAKYDVIIEHDLLYQTWKIPYNQALRNIAKKHPHIKWIHWCHSAPSARPHKLEYPHTLRFTPMPNSVWVTMNDAMRRGFALQYNTDVDNVKTVYHAIDFPTHRRFHPLSTQIWNEYKLWKPELVVVFISRFDHAEGKGVYDVAEFVVQLKKLDTTQLIYVNSWSHTDVAKKVIRELRRTVPDAIFTSEMGKQYEQAAPHEVVVDMLDIANIFIIPSRSETFSFTMAEAALGKNYIVLNRNLKPLVELMPEQYAKHVPWKSDWGGEAITETYHPNKELFMYDRAKEVYEDIQNNKPLKAHRRALKMFSPEWIWQNQYKPLLEENK